MRPGDHDSDFGRRVEPQNAPPTRELDDPWGAIGRSDPNRFSRGWRRISAVGLGSVGAVVRVWGDGPTQRAGAIALVATCIIVQVIWWSRLRLATRSMALCVVVGVSVPLLRRLIGATPLLLALAGVGVASAALVGWRPWIHHPGRFVPTAGLAVPLVVAGEISWVRSGAWAPMIAFLVSAMGIVEAYHLAPNSLGVLDGGVSRGVAWLARRFGEVVVFMVAVPALYTPGLLGRLAVGGSQRFRRRGDHECGSWSAVGASVSTVRTDAKFPFATTDHQSRATRVALGSTLAVAVLLALVIRVGTQAPEIVRRPVDAAGRPVGGKAENGGDTAYVDLPAMAGAEWAGELQAEERSMVLPPGPVAGFTAGDTTGSLLNVFHGERRTAQAARCDCVPIEVWFVGGSAAFGTGQRDLHTIASDLVELADAAGITLAVHNIAVPGWTLWQEYQAVLAALLSDRKKPDLVVFYDGLNDVASSFSDAILGHIDWSEPATIAAGVGMESLGFEPFERRLADLGGPAALGRRIGERFLRLRTLIGSSLRSMSIPSEFFFQPNASASFPQFEGFSRVSPRGFTPEVEAVGRDFAVVSDAVSSSLSGQVHDLLHLFDEESRPVFNDLAHTNELGAQVSAAAIFEDLRPALESVAGTNRR